MRFSALLVIAFALAACSRSDQDHARDQARQSAQQLKHDSREALHKTEDEADKASRELNNDLAKARQKTRQALGEPDNPPPDNDRQ